MSDDFKLCKIKDPDNKEYNDKIENALAKKSLEIYQNNLDITNCNIQTDRLTVNIQDCRLARRQRRVCMREKKISKFYPRIV